MYVSPFFIHSSTHGHLGCFRSLALVNNAARSVGYICLFKLLFLFPSKKYLGHMVVLFFNFSKNLCTIFCNASTNLYSHQGCTFSFYPHPSQHLFAFFFKKKILFYLFIFREREREGERETSMCDCLSCGPHWEPGPQPRHVS